MYFGTGESPDFDPGSHQPIQSLDQRVVETEILEKRSTRKKIRNILFVVLLPCSVYILFLILQPKRFGAPLTIFIIFQQAFIPSIMAMGLCFVMSLGLYDLSIGAIVILSAILGTKSANLVGGAGGVVVLIAVCVGASVLLELVNAVSYTYLRIPSLIVTIGLLMIYETIGNFINGAVLPFEMSMLGRAPLNIILSLLTMLLAYILFNRTRVGMHILAVGGSELIAQNSGIDVRMTKIQGFLMCGIFIGIASVMTVSYGGVIMPSTSLDSISRIFSPLMGYFMGLALRKYCNIIIGIFIGEFIILMIITGMMTMGAPSTFQQVITGLFLLVVVGLVRRVKKGEVVK
jgi:ribose transport system permease protein